MEAAAAHLMNLSQPFDCALLDQIVLIAMDSSHPQRNAAHEFLIRMKDHPDMWRRADAILETSKQTATKFFGLQVLGEAITTHWKVIPMDERYGIRSYVISKIITLCATEESMRTNSTFLNRLNLVLVQILKQDWPHNWPTFIPDIVESSKTSELLSENNMKVLTLLSEEIFEFSKDSLTAAKMKTMKETLNESFAQIFQLCEFILEHSQKTSLIVGTLRTLQRFLSWVALAFIFETNLVPGLIAKFLPYPAYRTPTLDCLIEIASLQPHEMPESYKPALQVLLVHFIKSLNNVIPVNADLKVAYHDGSENDQLFVARLALFLGTFLRSFLPCFDQPDGNLAYEPIVIESLVYMINVSQVPDEEVFKTCLEFWSHFAKELYTADVQFKTTPPLPQPPQQGGVPQQHHQHQHPVIGRPKHMSFETVLHSLRIIMIDRMAKPEEVIIVEDDNGEIVREQTKDTEVIAQYRTMKETLVYLTHLNYEDTESIMLEKLDLQVAGGMFSWNGLNTLCWAIGSISGAMGELDEKRFLVSVIKDLLRLCEEQKGKDNKAVVASNIMYIVGQYPRFLRAHWKFLKTVVNKLFEFMHEYHPGVQDMACDTFIKIAQKCKRKFMTPQQDDPQPFILQLIADLPKHTGDLQSHQVQSFYESVGTMLSDQGPMILLARDEVMLRLMESVNLMWTSYMGAGAQNINALFEMDAMRDLSKALKINAKVCSSAGSIYLHQLSLIFNDMLNLYRVYGDAIIAAVAQQGPVAVRIVNYRTMRSLKGDILDVFTAAVEAMSTESNNPSSGNSSSGHHHHHHGHNSNPSGQQNSSSNGGINNGHEVFMQTFMPGMLQHILADYQASPPQARDAKVLTLFSTAIATLKDLMQGEVPRIMEAVFEKTLEMITTNMLDYPDHRIAFFTFLRMANSHCFYGLFSIPAHHQKLVVDSIVWAFKHTERNISETGLEILLELLQNVAANPNVAQPFYVSFLQPLIQDVFGVLTDRTHKSGFKLQASVLKHLFHLTQAGHVTAPLQPTMSPNMDNATYLRDHVAYLLMEAFPNLSRQQVITFVRGLFDVSMDLNAFKQHLRDFLVTIKEFSTDGQDNSELFAEEKEAELELLRQEQMQYIASVPGLMRPQDVDLGNELPRDMSDLE